MTGKQKLLLIFLSLGFISLLVGCSMLQDMSDFKEKNFETKKEAQQLITNGWIPKEIPQNASHIQVVYNIDTNVVNGRFDSKPREVKKLLSTLSKTSSTRFQTETKALTSEYRKVSVAISKKPSDYYQNEDYIFVVKNHRVYFFRRIK